MHVFARLAATTRGGPPAAARGSGAGVREDHPRRARPDARGGQRRAAEAQFRGNELLHVPAVYWDYAARRDGDGAHPRRDHQRPRRAASSRRQHPAPRETASRSSSRRCCGTISSMPTCTPQHLVQLDDPERPKYCAVDFGIMARSRARTSTTSPRISSHSRAGLAARRTAARRLGLGAGRHARRRARDRRAHVCGRSSQAAVGDLLRPGAAQAVRGGAPLPDDGAAATDPAAEDAAADRGLGRQLYPRLDLWKTAQPILRGGRRSA